MEIVYFTAVAIIVYVVADAVLNGVERRLGRRIEYRSLVFFGIVLVLALVSFEIMGRLTAGE